MKVNGTTAARGELECHEHRGHCSDCNDSFEGAAIRATAVAGPLQEFYAPLPVCFVPKPK